MSGPKHCDDDKILNPKTNRCVSKSGAIGKALLKQQGLCADANKIFNPKTKRCVSKSGAVGKALLKNTKNQELEMKHQILLSLGDRITLDNVRRVYDPCYPSSIWNPETSRCVSSHTPQGRFLRRVLMTCADDQVFNPDTNRCVRRDSKLGKQIIASNPLEQTEEGRIKQFLYNMAAFVWIVDASYWYDVNEHTTLRMTKTCHDRLSESDPLVRQFRELEQHRHLGPNMTYCKWYEQNKRFGLKTHLQKFKENFDCALMQTQDNIKMREIVKLLYKKCGEQPHRELKWRTWDDYKHNPQFW